MVARRRAARVRVRPLRLVESLRLRPGGANHAHAGADGGGVRRAAMDFRDVELCLCRPGADRLRLYAGGARAPGRAGPHRRSTLPARYPVHRIRLGAGGGRPRRVSRRRARPPRQHRLPRSRLPPARGAEEGDRHSRSRRVAPRRLPDQSGERGIPDHRRGDRVRPVLSAAQSRLRRRLPANGRRCWSSATADRPRRHRARSISAFNSGPAAASPCSM